VGSFAQAGLHATFVAQRVVRTGGMERAVREVVLGLLERGWRISVVTHTHDLPERQHLRILRVPAPHRPFLAEFPLFAIGAAAQLRRVAPGPVVTVGAIVPHRADLVVLQYVNSSPGYERAAALGGLRARYQWLSRGVAVAAERWSYRPAKAPRFIAVSQALADELIDAVGPWPDVQVIPNGTDPAHFRPDEQRRQTFRKEVGVAEDEPLALFVGGDWDRKGLSIVIEALAVAPQWRLVVVGSGDPAPVRALAAQSGVVPRVVFVGPLTDTAPAFSAADAFVLPTAYEGFPLVSIEAAASGLPLILTAAANADQVLVNGATGFVVERSASAVAAALHRLEDREERSRMGRAAQERANLLSWPRIADRYDAVLRESATNFRR
jgi:UDP-glucose:(heptosyl)LPS alpha-1,3-glucosyltransferase